MAAIATSLSPVVLAVEKTEATTELAPVVVKGIRPLLKIAEHPVVEPRYGAAVVAEGDYLYLIGGSNDEGTRLDSVERIDLRTGRAEPWIKLQIPRRYHGAVIAGGKICVLGGTSGQGPNALTGELADYYGEPPPVHGHRGGRFRARGGRLRRAAGLAHRGGVQSPGKRVAAVSGSCRIGQPQRHRLGRPLPLFFGQEQAHRQQLVYDLFAKKLVPYQLPLPDSDFAAAVQHEGRIYVAGGGNLRLHETNDGIHVFAPSAESLVLTQLPPARSN